MMVIVINAILLASSETENAFFLFYLKNFSFFFSVKFFLNFYTLLSRDIVIMIYVWISLGQEKSLYYHYLVVMVQAAFNARFTKTTWKQLCAIRAIIMAPQLKADPSSVRWQLTPGWWLPFRWKIRFPATEWVSEWPICTATAQTRLLQYKSPSAALLQPTLHYTDQVTTSWYSAVRAPLLPSTAPLHWRF